MGPEGSTKGQARRRKAHFQEGAGTAQEGLSTEEIEEYMATAAINQASKPTVKEQVNHSRVSYRLMVADGARWLSRRQLLQPSLWRF